MNTGIEIKKQYREYNIAYQIDFLYKVVFGKSILVYQKI